MSNAGSDRRLSNADIAHHVAIVALLASEQLSNLLPWIEQHASPDDYAQLEAAISAAVGHIDTDLLAGIYASCPGLEQDIAARRAKYGELTYK